MKAKLDEFKMTMTQVNMEIGAAEGMTADAAGRQKGSTTSSSGSILRTNAAASASCSTRTRARSRRTSVPMPSPT
jgi:hypothetical protein